MTAPRKAPINSRRKGAAAELEFAHRLTALGYPAERGQQRKGGEDSPDVICKALAGIHWEVKFYKTCQIGAARMIEQWDAQAVADAGRKLPVIVHRWNGQTQWWVRVVKSERGPYWQTLEHFLAHHAKGVKVGRP